MTAISLFLLKITGGLAAIGAFFLAFKKIFKVITLIRKVFDTVDDLRAAFVPDSNGNYVVTKSELELVEKDFAEVRSLLPSFLDGNKKININGLTTTGGTSNELKK